MKNMNFRVLLSAVCIASVLAGFSKVNAGPISFGQVVQVVNARPGKAEASNFSRLRVAGDYNFLIAGDDDNEDKKKGSSPAQDDRVITETRSSIELDEDCDCVQSDVVSRGFPKRAQLGLAAIPIAFILIHTTKTPTPTVPPVTQTPTATPTGTSTPPMTPTPTPQMTPSPTPEPIPEPMTILLFGTGLASIGLAARRKFGKKGETLDENEEE